MRKAIVTIGALIVVICMGWAIWYRTMAPVVLTQAPDEQVATTFPPQTEPKSDVISNMNANAKLGAEPKIETIQPQPKVTAPQHLKPVQELAPTRDLVREQVGANPHQPPPAMIQFTVELYNRRMQALQSEGQAEKFFGDLESCVNNKESAFNAQGMCLLNADYLQAKYSSLGGRFERLKAEANPEALKFMQGIKSRAKR